MITIDHAIKKLQRFRKGKNLGGDAILVLSLADSGLPVKEIHDLHLEENDVGAVVEVRAPMPDIGIDWKKLWDDFDDWIEEASRNVPRCETCDHRIIEEDDPDEWENQQVKIEELINDQLKG
jgi:hypothetical protein